MTPRVFYRLEYENQRGPWCGLSANQLQSLFGWEHYARVQKLDSVWDDMTLAPYFKIDGRSTYMIACEDMQQLLLWFPRPLLRRLRRAGMKIVRIKSSDYVIGRIQCAVDGSTCERISRNRVKTANV